MGHRCNNIFMFCLSLVIYSFNFLTCFYDIPYWGQFVRANIRDFRPWSCLIETNYLFSKAINKYQLLLSSYLILPPTLHRTLKKNITFTYLIFDSYIFTSIGVIPVLLRRFSNQLLHQNRFSPFSNKNWHKIWYF
jgi:hypothetical protein